jgi:hypothetical protein
VRVAPKHTLAIRLALLCLLVVALSACEVDPLAHRSLPQVGTTFTSSTGNVPDIYTFEDGAEEAPTGDRGIDFADPSSGSPAGGEIIFLHGRGFEKGVLVFFNDTPAADVFYVNSKKLRIETPPHSLGAVDVAVQWPDGKVKLLPSGYLYDAILSITGVSPANGPITGGTPLTITGTGFTEDARLVVGTRLALKVQILDESTLVAVTPPGDQGGAADIIVSSLAGVKRFKDGYTYTVKPRLDGLLPAIGPDAGGNEVELLGKWLSPVTEVWFGDTEASLVEAKNDRLTVIAPPGQVGYVDVLVSGTWGFDGLNDGYYYYDEGQNVLTIVPDSGPEKGGTIATVAGCDLPHVVSKVTFGDAEAKVLGSHPADCAIVVEVPAGTGAVEVKVWGDNGATTFPQSYNYFPTLTVSGVSPQVGPAIGGTRITVTGSHFTEGMQVLVGPLSAADVLFVSDIEIEVTTPPGSPGLADVTVVAATGTAVGKAAFLYTVKEAEVWAITPDYGSRAGGTYIEILGAGFSQDAMVFIGANLATGVKVKSYGLIEGYAPANGVGTYDLSVTVSVGQAGLASAYSYFDPTSWYGGVWGPTADGAVNVTVLDAGTWEPLEGATVILGSDPGTKYKGLTDPNGHVTLSGPGLTGPVDVHTTKKEYDAASFVNVGAENATLYLIPLYPPSTGPTDPVEIPPPGEVAGQIIGLDKYLVVPPGDCKNKIADEAGLCSPCIANGDCEGSGECLAIGKSGKYCTSTCDSTDLEACPTGYMCAPVGSDGLHCVPALGDRAVRCQLSSPSIYSYMGTNDVVDAIPNADGKKMSYGLSNTRLGEVAIVCLGGWVDPDTGEFHPLTMGVKRHVNIAPGAELEDQNIWLNIPLSRTLRLRMDDPPAFDEYGGTYRVTAYLDFGSDGYFRLPGQFQGTKPEDVMLESLPAELAGEIYDASYLIYSGAYSNTYDDTPYSNLVVTELTELEETSVARLVEGAFVTDLLAPRDKALYAGWTNENGSYVVGGHGNVFLFKEGSYYQLPSVVDEPLYDLFGFPNGTLFAVGGHGVVVQYDGQSWTLLGAATDRALKAIWGSDPDDLHAVGRHRIVSYYQGEWHEQKISQALRDVWGNGPDNVWAVGEEGALLRYDGVMWQPTPSPTTANLSAVHVFPNGTLLIAGDGEAWMREGTAWTDLELKDNFRAHKMAVLSETEFYATGAAGEVAHWTLEGGFSYLPAPTNVQLNGLLPTADGVVLALGTPALLLTPMIPFPVMLAPPDEGTMDALLLAWTYFGNAEPITLHNIGITQKTGRSLWRLVVDGARTQIPLPDFEQLIGFNPLPPGEKRLRIHSAFAPDFSINSFDLSALSTTLWTSWSYDMIAFDEQP